MEASPEKSVADIVIACFGLAFKPNIDDLRESPSMYIAQSIANFHKGRVLAVEPNITELSSSESFELVSYQAAESTADIAILLVDHIEFQNAGKPNIEIVIDTKGIW